MRLVSFSERGAQRENTLSVSEPYNPSSVIEADEFTGTVGRVRYLHVSPGDICEAWLRPICQLEFLRSWEQFRLGGDVA